MKYKSKEINIIDIGLTVKRLNKYPWGKFMFEVKRYLKLINEDKYYDDSTPLLTKEWKSLYEYFDNNLLNEILLEYRVLVDEREKNKQINSLRSELIKYLSNHKETKYYFKPQKINFNINTHKIKTEFKYSYKAKVGDNDLINSDFTTEIDDKKFIYNLEYDNSYSSYPTNCDSYYKKNDKYFKTKERQIEKFLLDNLNKYIIYDLNDIIDKVFNKSFDERLFKIDYNVVNDLIYNADYFSEVNIPNFEILYPFELLNFEYLKLFKSIYKDKELYYYHHFHLRKTKIKTKNNAYFVAEIKKDNILTNALIKAIKPEYDLEEILLKTYNDINKYKIIGKITEYFDFKKLMDDEMNSFRKFKKKYDNINFNLNSNNYFLFKLSK